MKILCCGDRYWHNLKRIEQIFDSYVPEGATIIQGGCRGADLLCDVVATRRRIKTVEYPADWMKHGKSAGPIRNATMLHSNKDIELVIAFHDNILHSSGTADMIRRARRAGVRVLLVTSTDITDGYQSEVA